MDAMKKNIPANQTSENKLGKIPSPNRPFGGKPQPAVNRSL